LRVKLVDGERVERLVDDKPHGAVLFAMRAQIDDRMVKERIGHLRHGDEQLTGQGRHVRLCCKLFASEPEAGFAR